MADLYPEIGVKWKLLEGRLAAPSPQNSAGYPERRQASKNKCKDDLKTKPTSEAGTRTRVPTLTTMESNQELEANLHALNIRYWL